MKKLAILGALLVLTSIAAAQPTKKIELDLKNTEPTPLQTSEYADVWIEVTNNGNTRADNVRVEFLENYPYSVDPGDDKNWSIGELVPGEEYQIHLQAKVDENAVPGENSLEFRTETGSGDIKIEHKVPVEVRTDRNVLSIKNIQFAEKVAPGTTNEMNLELENLADSQLKNIQVKADVSSEDLPFATSESSTKNIAAIEPGKTTRTNFSIEVDETAENAVYKLPIDIIFENEAGTEFEQSSTTAVNVGGTPKLVPGLNTEEHLSPGKTSQITLRLVNRGHGSADFVAMELQENENLEVIGSNDVYIGSMDPDDFQTASYQVYIDEDVENLSMPLKISYTDQSGDQQISRNVEAEVYSQEQIQQYGLGSGNSILPLAVILLLLIAGGVYYWRRKRKK